MNRFLMMALAMTLCASFAFAEDAPETTEPAEESADTGEAVPEATEKSEPYDPFSLSFPLSDGPDAERIALKFFGQHRQRWGIRSPGGYAPGFAADQHPTDSINMRTRFGIKASFPGDIHALFEIQDVRLWGSEPRANANSGTANNTDVLQAFLHTPDLFGQEIGMWLGRQKFTVGNQRLWSTLEWAPQSRAWDGLRLNRSFADGQFDLMVFAMLVNELSRVQDDEWSLGMKFTWLPEFLENHEIELFTLYQTRDDVSGANDADVLSASLRWDGWFDFNDDMALDFSAEAVFQTGKSDSAFWYGAGTIDNANVSAFAAAITAGFNWTASDEHAFRFGLGFDYASGDGDPTDEKFETFRSPFPFGHKYNGLADQVGWRNLIDMYVDVNWTYTGFDWADKMVVGLAGHTFSRANDDDAWFNAGNGIIRGGTNNDSANIGSEIDITAKLAVNRWVTVDVGAAFFFAGGFVKDTATGTGPGSDNEDSGMIFFWAQVMLKF
ncbi:alginate export family protein [Planctomycetota bacterium]|nr:alginate export family protein [Planctomycetota bacterium]